MSTAFERPEVPRHGGRFLAFGVIGIILFAVIAGRLFQLQVIEGAVRAEQAEAAHTVTVAIPSQRGLVFDREGRPLIVNVPTWTVAVRPADLPEHRRAAVLDRVAEVTGEAADDLEARLDAFIGSPFDLVPLADEVDRQAALVLSEEAASLPGIELEVVPQRQYLNERGEADGTLLSHIVGYTGPINASELDELANDGYLHDDPIGRTGIESAFESALRGEYGSTRWERDASGRLVKVIEETAAPVAGRNLVLTIDARLQRLATESLLWGMREANVSQGVTIVMNPQNGEILAMVSLPAYDNNAFASGIPDELYQSYLADPNLPLRNHAIADIYPPGSTFKLVTGLAALQEGVTTPTRRWQTYGCYQIPGAPVGDCLSDWNRRGFGPLNMVEAFARSSDTFFYQMAVHLGVDRLARWANELGFGAPTGIALPSEAAGVIPSTEWAHSQGRAGIFTGELAQAGIGQNTVAVTPLQLMNAYAAVANGGHLMQPQIVLGEADADGNLVERYDPQVLRELAADPSNLNVMRIGARQVITTGHAYNIGQLRLPGALSGKTGTAEFGVPNAEGNLPFHSWFVAFLPSSPGATDSELAVMTFTYRAVVRGNVSTEVVKYFLQQYFELDQDLRLDPVTLRLLQGGN
ncbi:MAG TPA: penicillin-binding protein 2 [Candidatus Limnocylindria bacterium]|nr:penicillin-binding protein 2 [Candidatus Limnocylindria bacterium]